jgi:hypothetical protein
LRKICDGLCRREPALFDMHEHVIACTSRQIGRFLVDKEIVGARAQHTTDAGERGC